MERSIFLSTLAILLLFHSFSSSAAASDLDSLCSDLGGHYIQSSECYSIFKQDTRSSTADYDNLAVIVVDILIPNARNVLVKVNALLKSETDPSTKSVFQACLDAYSVAFPLLSQAEKAAKDKKFADAAGLLKQFGGAPQACIDASNEKKVSSPAAPEAAALEDVAFVAQTVNEIVAGK